MQKMLFNYQFKIVFDTQGLDEIITLFSMRQLKYILSNIEYILVYILNKYFYYIAYK